MRCSVRHYVFHWFFLSRIIQRSYMDFRSLLKGNIRGHQPITGLHFTDNEKSMIRPTCWGFPSCSNLIQIRIDFKIRRQNFFHLLTYLRHGDDAGITVVENSNVSVVPYPNALQSPTAKACNMQAVKLCSSS